MKNKSLILFTQLPIACPWKGEKIFAELDKKKKLLIVSVLHTTQNINTILSYMRPYKNNFNLIIPKTNYEEILPAQKLFKCHLVNRYFNLDCTSCDGSLLLRIRYTTRRFL